MLSNSFKWKHYEGKIILLNVRWYLKYPLSYRNLKEMMTERGIQVDHSTRIVNPMLGFQSFQSANKTLKGIEAMNMIKKGQVNDLNYSVFNEVKYINVHVQRPSAVNLI